MAGLLTQAETELKGQGGRVLLRYSGTEPLLRIMIEGADWKKINAAAQFLARLVRRDGV